MSERCMQCGQTLHYFGYATPAGRQMLFCPEHPGRLVLMDRRYGRIGVDVDTAADLVLKAHGIEPLHETEAR